MRRFLSNSDTLRSQRPEQEVLHPKLCQISNKHFEMRLFLWANKN